MVNNRHWVLNKPSALHSSRGQQTMFFRPNPVCCVFVKIKFYWHTGMTVVYILSRTDWRYNGENIYNLALDRKSLPTPTLDHGLFGSF